MKQFWCSIFLLIVFISCQSPKDDDHFETTYDVIVLGAGTGAIAAGIQAARSDAKTLLINPQPWLGGMLTSAGVSATDGNHKLHAGLWSEWRDLIRNHYGGADSLFTGWVSNTMFEPKIGEQYWRYLATKEKNLTIYNSTEWSSISKQDGWLIHIPSRNLDVKARVLIDGTDLGDVAAQVGIEFDLGMDSRELTGERFALEKGNDIIQDFTYVAILKDFGPGKDMTIATPKDYNKALYTCSCQHQCDDPKMHPCQTMLNYGKLPNKKYLINWPFNGNDYYASIVELNKEQRKVIYEQAKQHTLGFVYYIQTELGFKNLGLADDEFPTDHKLALLPYHREGRRIKGLIQMTAEHIQHPFNFNLYKTGIAVGDYPIDHHHGKNEDVPSIEFPLVPSFSIPLGSLIPRQTDNFLIADKAISVSNIANGSTRLQPVVLQIGQAAGLIAGHVVKNNISTRQVKIRDIQNEILDAKGYIMPFIDVTPDHNHFRAIQRVAATGILKGRPVPYKWANQTWFDPDSLLQIDVLKKGLMDFDKRFSDLDLTGQHLSQQQTQDVIFRFCELFDLPCKYNQQKIIPYNLPVTRAEFSSQIDLEVNPFSLKQLDFDGNFIQ